MEIFRLFRAAFILFCLLAWISPRLSSAMVPGDEKNLRGRLGVGFENQIATAANTTIPSMSLKYYTTRTTAAALDLGFNTTAGNSTAAVGLKGYKNVFLETNLLFYLGAGAAYVNHNGSKLQGSAFFGSEFFFDRLPSLGFTFEAGIRGDSESGTFAIRTTGSSFLTAGMHFYL